MTRIWILFFLLYSSFQEIRSEDDSYNEEPLTNGEIENIVQFTPPTVNTDSANIVELFNDKTVIGAKWLKSKSKKDDTDENIAKYDGQWSIGTPEKVVFDADYSLIAMSKARHHAIASRLKYRFNFADQKPLVLQYEVRYEDGQECGGGYLKLLESEASKTPLENFNDKTPYVIMFGPDKCGLSAKVHFILKYKNPKNGTISEYHAKQPSKTPYSYFDDKKTHLYTLVVKPDNNFIVYVDHTELISGNLLQDLGPSLVPPKQIYDQNDQKPKDFDEREMIEDASAVKPDDWDENQPREVPDENAVKPNDWLEEAEPLVFDSESRKPQDWDVEMDGEWEPKKIPNPECEGRSGCGPWKRPMKSNPLYKGKWIRPKVKNPSYKGKWTPRLIENPDYFEPEPFKQLPAIGAIGIELWTMSANIHFDNVILSSDEALVSEFGKQTFDLKSIREKEVESTSVTSTASNFVSSRVHSFLEAAEENPWLWVVAIFAVLIPLIGISVFCFGRKTSRVHPKKTDEVQADEEDDFEQVEMENVADESIILPDEEASSSKNGGSADIQTLNSTSTNSTPSRRSSASDSKPSSTKSTPKNGKSTFSERSETGGPKNGSRTRAAANTSVAPEEAHLAPEEKEPEQRRSPRQRVRARLQD